MILSLYDSVHSGFFSGNWDYLLASHRSLDPRYVWKLEVDFEPATNLPPDTILKIALPTAGTTITTNFLNVPVSISWQNNWVEVSIPTNQPKVALKYLSVEDGAGNEASQPSGSWNQYRFRKGSFMWPGPRIGMTIISDADAKTVTFAIVTNVHATFYVQPVLLPGEPEK